MGTPSAVSRAASDCLAAIRGGELAVPLGYQPWLKARLPDLQGLVDLATDALAGQSAVHGDVRPDNLLLDLDGRCWTLDWNWLSLGPQWADWVGLLPLAHHEGIDTSAHVRANPLTSRVPADHLDCFAAVSAVYHLSKADAPHPPDCTHELRRHQRRHARLFLDWIAMRRGW